MGLVQDTGLRLKHSFDTTTSIKRISFPPLGDSGFCATSAGVVDVPGLAGLQVYPIQSHTLTSTTSKNIQERTMVDDTSPALP